MHRRTGQRSQGDHEGMDGAAGPRPAWRSSSDRWISGVAGGLAEHFGVPSWAVRLAFLVTTLIGGAGIVAYLLLWLFLPIQPQDPASATGVRAAGSGLDLTGVLSLLALGLGILLALSALGLPVPVSLWGPILIVAAGAVVLWRQSDELSSLGQRARSGGGIQATAGLSDRQGWVRALVGIGLVIFGLVAAIGPQVDLVSTGWTLAAVGALLSGVVIIALPWLSTWVKGLEAQRYATARAEERAAMAARVHDSVLQTLTLIQRRADDPVEVARLARSEERALRAWLYAPRGASGSLSAQLADMVAVTEADYDVRIDLVTVGDAVVDDRLAALIAATREAVVNAAKHAGAPATVYAEVDEEQVEVNVRDRGSGFDAGSVRGDRHGIRESIVARMAGVGGRATVRSEPGQGTEVRLVLPMSGGGDE